MTSKPGIQRSTVEKCILNGKIALDIAFEKNNLVTWSCLERSTYISVKITWSSYPLDPPNIKIRFQEEVDFYMKFIIKFHCERMGTHADRHSVHYANRPHDAFVLSPWATRPTLRATRPHGHKKDFVRPAPHVRFGEVTHSSEQCSYNQPRNGRIAFHTCSDFRLRDLVGLHFHLIFDLAVLEFHCGRFGLICGRFGRGRFGLWLFWM